MYRDEAAIDRTGIDEKRNVLGIEVDIDFVRDGRLYAHFGLYNGGRHDLHLDAAPARRSHYWAFEGMALSTDPDDGVVGVASRRSSPEQGKNVGTGVHPA